MARLDASHVEQHLHCRFEAIVRWWKAGSALEPLDDLTDEEIATKLPVHLRYLPDALAARMREWRCLPSIRTRCSTPSPRTRPRSSAEPRCATRPGFYPTLQCLYSH
ncbi:hypothetical protein GFL77_11710 [Rhizobium leguminosarum bv. viciae]|nr:hypothetical protein [Rhizobium leguminosarum bv. viciae]